MQIKISFFILFALIVFSSCEDVIDLKVPDGDIQLVVDGWLTNLEGEKQVLLSTTANYFDNTEPPKVTGALVVLYNEAGLVDTLHEKEPGKYITEHVGQVGSTYHIYIRTTAGEVYESNPETLRFVPEISAIYSEFKEETAFVDEGYYISIDTNEPLGKGDHYRWKQYVNGDYLNEPFDLIYASDEFVDGNPILGFEVNTDPLVLGDHYRIQQLSISKEAHDFFSQLQEQTAFVGFLFDSPPSALNGNIEPVDPASKKALGYFGVSAVSEKEIVIE
ncbi:MAG: hypothetical protein DHS20C18_41940 [Saprospiraceae bacterium]|nr:MAG: hypothetical protein DHS20C18_41940 [Saprospiraceae bacterium]